WTWPETPQLVGLNRDRALRVADLHRGSPWGHDLAQYGATRGRDRYFDVDGQPAGLERDQPPLRGAAHQRRVVGVEQRVEHELGQIAVDVAPREGILRRLEEARRYRLQASRVPPERFLQLVIVGLVMHIRSPWPGDAKSARSAP